MLPPERLEIGSSVQEVTPGDSNIVTGGRGCPGEDVFLAGVDSVHVHQNNECVQGNAGEQGASEPRPPPPQPRPARSELAGFNAQLRDVYSEVTSDHRYNYLGAGRRVPSSLCIPAWRRYLADYTDTNLVDFLAFGWPVNFDRYSPLLSTLENHPSATMYQGDIEHYVATKLRHQALAGPFKGPPVTTFHVSPLMTRTKKDSDKRRVIVDLSWPDGASVNDGITDELYLDSTLHNTADGGVYGIQALTAWTGCFPV